MSESFFRQLRETLSPPDAAHETELPAPILSMDHSPLALAYVGDAVYELYVRVHLVQRQGISRDLQAASSALARASAQSRILGVLEPLLSDEEQAMVKRGRNAGSGRGPKRAAMIDYRRATGLECLLGYLLLNGREARLMELLEKALEPAPPVEMTL
jgi:ribonuclease-3 family protein